MFANKMHNSIFNRNIFGWVRIFMRIQYQKQKKREEKKSEVTVIIVIIYDDKNRLKMQSNEQKKKCGAILHKNEIIKRSLSHLIGFGIFGWTKRAACNSFITGCCRFTCHVGTNFFDVEQVLNHIFTCGYVVRACGFVPIVVCNSLIILKSRHSLCQYFVD